MGIETVVISRLEICHDLQARAGDMSEEVIADYSEAMIAGAVFPPVVVFSDEKSDGQPAYLAAAVNRLAVRLLARRSRLRPHLDFKRCVGHIEPRCVLAASGIV